MEYRHVKRRNSVVSCYAWKEVVHSFWDDVRCSVYDEVERVHSSYAEVDHHLVYDEVERVHFSYAEVDHDLAYDEVEPVLVHSSYVETLM